MIAGRCDTRAFRRLHFLRLRQPLRQATRLLASAAHAQGSLAPWPSWLGSSGRRRSERANRLPAPCRNHTAPPPQLSPWRSQPVRHLEPSGTKRPVPRMLFLVLHWYLAALAARPMLVKVSSLLLRSATGTCKRLLKRLAIASCNALRSFLWPPCSRSLLRASSPHQTASPSGCWERAASRCGAAACSAYTASCGTVS